MTKKNNLFYIKKNKKHLHTKQKKMDPLIKRILVEILGTFLLVFVVLTTGNYLAIGATLALAVFLGHGCYNPAVALAQFLKNQINSTSIVAIIIAQLIGAGVAYFLSRGY